MPLWQRKPKVDTPKHYNQLRSKEMQTISNPFCMRLENWLLKNYLQFWERLSNVFDIRESETYFYKFPINLYNQPVTWLENLSSNSLPFCCDRLPNKTEWTKHGQKVMFMFLSYTCPSFNYILSKCWTCYWLGRSRDFCSHSCIFMPWLSFRSPCIKHFPSQ